VADDQPGKKLARINQLCKEFAETLRKFPFKHKMDEAKAKAFLNGVRDVLQAHTIKLESPEPKKIQMWEPEDLPPVDPEKNKAALEAAREALRRRGKDGGTRDTVN